MHRRGLLAALAGAPLLSLGGTARGAAEGALRLKSLSRDVRGTTLFLALDHAPFPAPGAPYRDDTVIVFVPAHYRFKDEEGVAALVHFHGHNTTAERAVTAHELREQLADSRQNAVLFVPQLGVMAPDSSCGKLESPGGLARLLFEGVAAAAREGCAALGDTAFPSHALLGTVCLSAHSGGYHAAASCLRAGGVDVREAYLFDALYAELDVFREWVVAHHGESLHRRHKLVSYFTEGGATEGCSGALRAQLEHAGVLCEHEAQEGELSRRDLSHADAVFVRTGLWHSNVTWETNALRDCLYASALPRHLPTTWFARKTGARPLEKRHR
ncbi:MAG TPA: hypothetical protein VN894_13135 [Polyangiaceae bacterium]|nr:hypothetical protein [Polyangiaceae bacterium]